MKRIVRIITIARTAFVRHWIQQRRATPCVPSERSWTKAEGAEISAKTISRLIQFRESVTNVSIRARSLSLHVRFALSSLPLPTCVRHSRLIALE